MIDRLSGSLLVLVLLLAAEVQSLYRDGQLAVLHHRNGIILADRRRSLRRAHATASRGHIGHHLVERAGR